MADQKSSKIYRKQKRVGHLTKQFLADQYIVKGKTLRQIGRENKHSPATVLKYLRAFGLPVRKIWGK